MNGVSELDQPLPIHQKSHQLFSKVLSSNTLVPCFSEAAMKLCTLSQNENSTMDEFAEIISLDPGLTSRCLKVASSIGFAARPIDNIQHAVVMIGIRQIRRIAFSAATIDALAHFRSNVDWQRFWLHNILVARLAERVSSHFRTANGKEYLAGLLHDVGKLIIEHYFPQEFDQIMTLAAERACRHLEVEREVLGIDHCRIGGVICGRLEIHPHIVSAVQFHHDPRNEKHINDASSDAGFLACCVGVADRLANHASAYTQSSPPLLPQLERTPEWIFLNRMTAGKGFTVDLAEELIAAKKDLDALLAT
jgi:HD-like signal output (HDOD) protein